MDDSKVLDDFYQKLSEKFPYVTSRSWEKLREISVVKYLEKDDIFLRHGERLHFGIFVVTGWLKLYYLDEKGDERISAFCESLEYIDNWNSIHQQQALPYSVSAITSSTIILYPLEKMVKTFSNEPDLLQLCVDLSQEMIRKKQEHYEILTLRSPEERYLHLLESKKNWLQEISLTNLAKFLHVSREALSRARNQVSLKRLD
ncbi:Crp/Fnr family transcriptional regulator [Sphingobacterium sp. SGR-19]|uniref:Crp/Fnr family transcriptional regulator n=1 Tax=Sphingobacterium sp. SGR-19 TaxID=2710886 RepID=UPI0013EB513D|nr:Crp/Fnr family transcriptional regulator [Sphingobacterium sp. SGR-19]NGM66860.1 Crp/Fnr family transcriptional regulator [Sphingobacterium sp. SGR-19]